MPLADIMVLVDGREVRVPDGAIAIAALVLAERLCTRRSLGGEARFALCGIGQCQECRVSIDGQPHRLACQVRCHAGMEIRTASANAS